MIRTALYFVVMAAAMLGLARLLPGFQVKGIGPAILAAFVLALVNTLVRPVLFILTLPFTLVTLGLFLFVLNVGWSLFRGERAGNDPWGAGTLEWSVPSPPNEP